APGDINARTANLTNQGLQRSLLMATFLNQQVLGGKNVTGIYALEPMTHLQTANDYPDMVGLETIQQFAMLNQITLSSDQEGGTPYTGQSYPINDSYADVPLPIGVVPPQQYCANCQGLDFRDQDGDNEALLTTIVKNNPPGFYVFSAPWETVSALLANINKLEHYNLALPASYISPNFIYAISIAPSGSASLVTYDSHITPPATYPVLSPPLASAACTAQTPFSITVTAGQWRALDLPNALLGKVNVNQVYSNDPSQFGPGSFLYSSDGSSSPSRDHNWSTVAPPLTAVPYAIANNLHYNVVTSFDLSDNNVDQETSTFFFFSNGGQFSNQTVLLAWSFQFIQPTILAMLTSY